MRADRATRLQGSVDRTFAEDVTITPAVLVTATDVNGRMKADTSRAPVTIQAVWTAEWSDRLPVNSGTNGTTYRGASTSMPAVKLSTSALPWPAGKGFGVTRIATGERYTVATVRPDGSGRIVLGLTGR